MARADLALRRLQTQALLDLARIGHLADAEVDRALRDEGLADITSAQANALLALVNARAPMTAARLAEALSVSEVTVGRFVRALVAGGWVARARDPSDSRAWRLTPTAKTRAELPKFIRVTNGLLDRAFADLGAEELERIARCLARIRDRLDERRDA